MRCRLVTFTLCSALICPTASQGQTFNTIYTFPNLTAGYDPNGTLYIGDGGTLFGATAFGGACTLSSIGCGTVYSLAPPAQPSGTWTQTVLYGFTQLASGVYPESGVLPGPAGSLYDTTRQGGPVTEQCHYGCGTFVQITPPAQPGESWAEQVLLTFPKADYQPMGLVAGSNGVFFGFAISGGSSKCSGGCGSIYELEPPAETGGPWTLTQIHQFSGDASGEYPNYQPVVGDGGVLYGTTFEGGSTDPKCFGCGAVYSLTPPTAPATTWKFQIIYRFHGGLDGLYGTTDEGGGNGCGGYGCGTIFSLTPTTEGHFMEAVIYSFQGGNDGVNPYTLSIGTNGVLYGVTNQGGGTGCGGPGCGILFQLSPPTITGGSWTESILHTFTGGADGQNPLFAPVIDSNGLLYGTAAGGTGTSCQGMGCGVIYQYTP
jgi:uncharacterized protein YceK